MPIGMWEELYMIQLYPWAYEKRYDNSTHRPVGRDVTTLHTSLWKEL
jgi:hypothetical protein